MQEERQQMLDRRISAEEGSQTRNLRGKGSPNMLRAILRQVSNAGDNPGQDDFFVKEFRKTCGRGMRSDVSKFEMQLRTRNLTSASGPNFCFIILQKLHVLPDQLLPDKLYTDGFRELIESVNTLQWTLGRRKLEPH
jgi:hypothetical protein